MATVVFGDVVFPDWTEEKSGKREREKEKQKEGNKGWHRLQGRPCAAEFRPFMSSSEKLTSKANVLVKSSHIMTIFRSLFVILNSSGTALETELFKKAELVSKQKQFI